MTRSRTATRDRFLAGARIGDYVVDSELRSEETGVVYEATHVVLPRRVALKVMHAQSGWLRSMAIQMLREACLLEALHHPGIPRVYECGVLADRRPWTAFEHASGTPLSEQLDGGSTIPLVDVVVVLRDVADLLAHAHGRGVVHRSLTPEAILRTPERTFPVCVERWDHALTLDTEERVHLDTRDDVEALGLIAYRALTGAEPDGKTTIDRCPGAPHELASLLDAMLSPNAVHRPSSEEVRDRARWLAGTLEPLERARWTPPRGVSDAVPVVSDDGGFSVRISSRTRTSG